ncbi:MAG: anaerobic ribonucleoside-triphosphate reductase activating protein [Dehalococcoidia bacterium]|nr:anaerobic ribonucleoside-triphosphate reductase activating protein [Dehalococcoidia bacterium]
MVYTSPCNFRCPFCHNAQLARGDILPEIDLASFWPEIEARRGFVDGVVITGGEPTLQPGLMDFMQQVQTLGFSLKLDTNGYRPEILRKLLEAHCVDYVAMDIKTSWEKYSQATGVPLSIKRLQRSVEILHNSPVEHEFRTTCVPGLVQEDDILQISRGLASGESYVLQQFQPCGTLEDSYSHLSPYSPETICHFQQIAQAGGLICRVTGL